MRSYSSGRLAAGLFVLGMVAAVAPAQTPTIPTTGTLQASPVPTPVATIVATTGADL